MHDSTFPEKSFTILDGAMGTCLQALGLPAGQRPELLALENPDLLERVHRSYAEAGAQILYANTFGLSEEKLAGSGYTPEEAVAAAIGCARRACTEEMRVALDIGSLGQLLEPAGTLPFEEAYARFARLMRAGKAAGADLVVVETMTDLQEARAAVLAAQDETGLPVMASMSFEEDGRTFSGVPVEAMALVLGGLGMAALGINCSLGPAAILPLAKRLCAVSPVPVFIKPNAGLPNPTTGAYSLGAEAFAAGMEPYLDIGVSAMGGCCGTTPEAIAALAKLTAGRAPAARQRQRGSLLCSATHLLRVEGIRPVGERINPTGKKRFQQALRAGDMALVQSLAVQQERAGAQLLDVNVGAPGVNEVTLLPRVVLAVQAVTGLPLVLDSADTEALEAALRVYCGKALVNSTSGEADKLAAVLPLCRRYGAAVVGLTIDEGGVPAGADARLAIARRIAEAADKAGLPREDLYIDCLTLTAGAGGTPADETLRALRAVKQELGVKTLLGVSNVSFGLPRRPLANQSFLLMALQSGLDLPILNPEAEGMMDAITAFRLLTGQDPDAKAYVARFAEDAPAASPTAAAEVPLREAVEAGLKAEAAATARRMLEEGAEGLALVNGHMVPALDAVGEGFETGRLFLPQLLAAAGAAQAAFEEIRKRADGAAGNGHAVVVATVQGDVHDIGKNIARLLLENYGFTVIDLGRDVAPERVAEAVAESGARLAGLSALMTTTLPAMEATVRLLAEAHPDCRVMVGGAVLTPGYAKRIGAHYHVPDAKSSVDAAREVYGL